LITSRRQQIVDEVPLIQQNVHIIIVICKQNSGCLHIRSLTGQMEGSCDYLLRMGFFLGLELPEISELAHAYIDSRNTVSRKARDDRRSVLLDSHREGFLKSQMEPMRLFQEFD